MAEKIIPLIKTIDLTRVYGNGTEIRALDGVSFEVYSGDLITVMGPSGSGKSTLLNLLGALDLPTGGQVFINGKDLATIKDKDNFRARTVGFIFQLHNLLPTMTARENIEIPMYGHLGPRERRKRSAELLELVGLADRMKHLPNQLSGGQRQRVAVARALANNPPLVLADEPTGSLDSTSSQELMNLIRSLNQTQNQAFLIVTHDPAVARQTKRVLVMADGKISREDHVGSPLEEDLKMWRYSGLGRRVVTGEDQIAKTLGVSENERESLAALLEKGN